MPSQRSADDEVRAARLREQELRRSRGEISCAECRRLKLRCDKKVPCSSCQRRGCQTICPNGTLSGGQGSRFVLADSDKLHRKLLEMSERIRQLEDALTIAYGGRASDPHPLLTDELLAVKRGIDAFDTPRAEAEASRVHAQAVDRETLEAFGALSISEGGPEKFLGLSSGAMRLTNISFDPPEPLTEVVATLPRELQELAKAWPFPPIASSASEVRALIERQLPPWERATALCEAFLGNLSWFFRPILRDQLLVELLPAAYRRSRADADAAAAQGATAETGPSGPVKPPVGLENVTGWRGWSGSAYERTHGNTPSPASTTSTSTGTVSDSSAGSPSDSQQSQPQQPQEALVDMHELAVVLMALAIGAVGDLTQAHNNAEAELFAQLARVAMATQPIFDGASLATVQAVSMMGVYTVFSARKGNLEPSWVVFYIAYSVAASLGLHRDPARWHVDPKIVNRRRSLFWELFTINNWQSLASGRPNLFCLHSNDVEFPEDNEATIDDDGKVVPGYWRWKHKFTLEILAPVTERMAIASSMKYSDVLDLDRSLRDFHLEFYRRPKLNVQNGSLSESDILQYTNSSIFMDVVSMYMHRNFFAKAVLDHPANPLRSPYAPSFLSGYRAATTILKTVREQFQKHGALLLRLWPVWAHSLSAAVMVASVVTRGPSSALAPAAFIELGLAVSLFEKAVMHPVVRQGLPILVGLREKAQLAIYEQRASISTLQGSKREDKHEKEKVADEEMATLPERPRAAPVQQQTQAQTLSPKRNAAADSSAPNSHHPSRRQSPNRHIRPQDVTDFDHLISAQIPQAVRDTDANAGGSLTYPLMMPYSFPDLAGNVHPELFGMADEYQALFGVLGSSAGGMPAAAAVAQPMFSEPGPSWQHSPSSAPSLVEAARSPSTSNAELRAMLAPYLLTPSAFVQNPQPSQPTQPTQAPHAASALDLHLQQPPVPSIDYTSLLGDEWSDNALASLQAQMPMDATMDDAWKVFVQSSGFQDPGIFEL